MRVYEKVGSWLPSFSRSVDGEEKLARKVERVERALFGGHVSRKDGKLLSLLPWVTRTRTPSLVRILVLS
eukprot:scaffold234315_cov31-Tisochrysis_lutea.AAC.1